MKCLFQKTGLLQILHYNHGGDKYIQITINTKDQSLSQTKLALSLSLPSKSEDITCIYHSHTHRTHCPPQI